MSVLSRSVTTGQRGRSFAGAPIIGAEGDPGAAAIGGCRCAASGPSPETPGPSGAWDVPAATGTFGMRGNAATPGAASAGGPSVPRFESTPAEPTPAEPPEGRGPGTVTVLYPNREPMLPPRGAALRRADRFRRSIHDPEAGMATAEYAIATLAAVAFAAVLVAVLGSGEVRSLLMGLIRSALTLG